MGETLPLFAASCNASLSVEARPEWLTGDAGALLVREMIKRTGIIGWMVERLHDPRQPHLVCYPLADLLRTMLVLFAQGWRDQDDADALRFDSALRLAVAGARGTTPLAEGVHLASQPTLSRLLDILILEANRPALREALRTRRPTPASRARWPAPSPPDHQRRQPADRGARRPARLGLERSLPPAHVSPDRRLRPGNAHTAEGALDFVLDLVDRLEGMMCQFAMVRMDAGFLEEKLLAGLETRGTPYVAQLRNNRALDRMAAPHLRRPPGRPPTEPRLWFQEMDYRAGAWSRCRRVVLVVQERPNEPAARPFLAAYQHRRHRRAGRGTACS